MGTHIIACMMTVSIDCLRVRDVAIGKSVQDKASTGITILQSRDVRRRDVIEGEKV